MARDPAYWRRWRAAHPEYVARESERVRRRRLARGREDRTAEYARARERRAARRRELEPVPPVFPDLARGVAVEFWDEALAADLRQERELALLEGRDPDEAARLYAARERTWAALAGPLEPT